MTGVVGYIYSELYGMGIFLAFSMGLIVARATWKVVHSVGRKRWLATLAPLLAVLLLWTLIARDGVADFHYDRGRAAFLKGDYASAQYHYEKSDRWLWQTPNLLIYHLYIIYKNTGQEEKRQDLYERYEKRRRAQGKT